MSHRSAPVATLERIAVSETERPKLVANLLDAEPISEAMVVSTCNRVEIYVLADTFHPALNHVLTTLEEHSGVPAGELTDHLYVRYAEAAAEHLLTVASGLDSMVVGEQQIIGQIRTAYTEADDFGSAGPALHELAQRALHTGKRVHTETGIDAAGASVVSVALERGAAVLSPSSAEGADSGADTFARANAPLAGTRALVLGAGAMAGLAVAHLGRAGVDHITIANRTVERADRLAEIAREAGVSAEGLSLEDRHAALAAADIVISATGAVGPVITVADAHDALIARGPARPLVICDLSMPRDVDEAVAQLPGVSVIDIAALQDDPAGALAQADERLAREIVAAELDDYLDAQRMREVTPTVKALRAKAAEVMAQEMMRFDQRNAALDEAMRAEVASTVQRVVDKLLHAPTVQVKRLATSQDGSNYAAALATLFDLQPHMPTALSVGTEISVDLLVGQSRRPANPAAD